MQYPSKLASKTRTMEQIAPRTIVWKVLAQRPKNTLQFLCQCKIFVCYIIYKEKIWIEKQDEGKSVWKKNTNKTSMELNSFSYI